jgi:hypothetical protein
MVVVMMVRTAFVANSSSSSFLIKLDKLSAYQRDAVENHIKYSQDMPEIEYKEECESWDITVSEEHGVIIGNTGMDNFDMQSFLHNIGVDDKDVEWSEWYGFDRIFEDRYL